MIVVIPLKNGLWRTIGVTESEEYRPGVVRLSPRMWRHWNLVYRRWYVTKGRRLAISPEMWVE